MTNDNKQPLIYTILIQISHYIDVHVHVVYIHTQAINATDGFIPMKVKLFSLSALRICVIYYKNPQENTALQEIGDVYIRTCIIILNIQMLIRCFIHSSVHQMIPIVDVSIYSFQYIWLGGQVKFIKNMDVKNLLLKAGFTIGAFFDWQSDLCLHAFVCVNKYVYISKSRWRQYASIFSLLDEACGYNWMSSSLRFLDVANFGLFRILHYLINVSA